MKLAYVGMLPIIAGVIAVTAQPNSAVTFHRDVVPILQKGCQECHRSGEIGPMSLISYRETRPWAKAIKEAVRSRKMPPWFADRSIGKFKNDNSLTQSEIELISAWVDAGAPEGDPKQAPPPVQFLEGWTIGKPDVIVEVPIEYEVPATGTIEYTYVVVPSGFKEDKWIAQAEVRPSNRSVVHHSQVVVRPPGSKWLANCPIGTPCVPPEQTKRDPKRPAASTFAGGLSDREDQLANYAPGCPPIRLAEGQARLVPAGSDFVFQLHYTPNGKPAKDQPKIGLVFAKQPVREKVIRAAAGNDTFVIPAGAANHRVDGVMTLGGDVKLVSLRPHMHLRGRSMEINAVYPTGEKEKLLNVPRYDFNWQLEYILDTPKLLPKGTRIEVTGIYDNSPNNRYNPDPTTEVRYGDQSWQEMMSGIVYVAIDPKADRKDIASRVYDRTKE
jgi:hypothetical protein